MKTQTINGGRYPEKFYQVEVYTGGAVAVFRNAAMVHAWKAYEHERAKRPEVKLYRVENGRRHLLAMTVDGVETLSDEMTREIEEGARKWKEIEKNYQRKDTR